MSTSDNNEDGDACPVDGRNSKKVRFKGKEGNNVEMLVGPVSSPSVSWKDLLLRNFAKSTERARGKNKEHFNLEERDFFMTIVNGILAIDFSDRVKNYLLKDIETTVMVKLLGRSIGYITLQNRVSRVEGTIFVNLDKPLISQILVNGKTQRVEYESLPIVFFSCGRHGHVKDLCSFSAGTKGNAGEKEGSMETKPITGDSMKEATEFGPWTIVDRRSHRNLKYSSKSVAKIPGSEANGSRFRSLVLMEKGNGE
ncbi:hypothetical protein Golob_008167 [Gossypium lobatum]|uniref:Zinc knuckle CX2CX4HX4C domain-containing protein n=1 Tax=Gossypium lobatum TaxID=34289 RepID=A0A7J8MEP7_9ROSI|nr:hypothetical protein [Gossypium lobatum]